MKKKSISKRYCINLLPFEYLSFVIFRLCFISSYIKFENNSSASRAISVRMNASNVGKYSNVRCIKNTNSTPSFFNVGFL